MAHKFNAAVLAILDALDGDRKTRKATCPVCGKHALCVDIGKWQPVTVYCFGGDGDHSNDVVAKLREMGVWPTSLGLETPPAAEEHRSEQDRRRYAVQIWQDLRESGRRMAYLLLGYLSRRGIKEVPVTARLTMPIAYHDSRTLSHDPGMVFPFMNKKGVVQGIHVVWLNGMLSGKREAEPVRQSYGLVRGNFIPLFAFDPKQRLKVLLIGEGPETVMAAMQLTGLPGIATAGKSFMAHLDPPPADAYVLLVDQDDNGGSRKAAGELAQRIVGCTVLIALPRKPRGGKSGFDWNDALIVAGSSKTKQSKLAKMITEAPPFETVMTVEEKREVRLNALAEVKLEDHLAYEEQRTRAAKELGFRTGVLDTEVEDRCKLLKEQRERETPPAPANMELLEASARDIINSEDVLGMFLDDCGQLIAGERTLLCILYLAGTTRLFDKAMHIAIKGISAGGKSETRRTVLEYFPPEAVISFTTVSEKALLHWADDFTHKIISMGEAHGREESDLQNYLLRELMSEGVLRYPCAQKVGNKIITVTIEKHGPCAFMVTTTKNQLNPENETRMLSLEIDDSAEQTAAVVRKVALMEGLNRRAKTDLQQWHDYQRWLAAGERRVLVPYAMTLARLIKQTKHVRLRRDFRQLLLAIKAYALLHRAHRERNADGIIWATIADYASVRKLMSDLMATAAQIKVRKQIIETVAAVQDLVPDLFRPSDDRNSKGAEVHDVAAALKLDRSAAWRRLKAAEAAGLLVNLEDRRGKPGRYRATSVAEATAGEAAANKADGLLRLAADDSELLPTAKALRTAYAEAQAARERKQVQENVRRTGESAGG
jgi:hypothetical protein